MVRLRLRFAAGVSVLAAGVLISGAAVAAADPDSAGSGPNGDHGGSSSRAPLGPAGGHIGDIANTAGQITSGVTGKVGSGTQTGQQPSIGVTSTLGSGRQPGERPSTGATSPKTEAGGTAENQRKDARSGTVEPSRVAAVPDVVTPFTDAVAPVTDAVAPAPVAPVALDINIFAPVPDLTAAASDVVALVAGSVVPLTQLPSDLSNFMLAIAGAPSAGGGPRDSGTVLSPAAGAVAEVSVVPVTDNQNGSAALNVVALGRVSALSERAPQASYAASLTVAQTSFRDAFPELLLTASLWVLAAVALPGIGGILVLTVIGVRMQYGSIRPASHRGERRALRTPPGPQAGKRWWSAR